MRRMRWTTRNPDRTFRRSFIRPFARDMDLTKETPPAFWPAATTIAKHSEGLAELYLKFKRAGASAGIATSTLGPDTVSDYGRPIVSRRCWPSRFEKWLGDAGFCRST